MKVYIVTCLKFSLSVRYYYHGIFVTEEEARAYAKNFKAPRIFVYDLDNESRKDLKTGAFRAIDSIDI